MTTFWDNLIVALEWLYSYLTIILKSKEKRKGTITSSGQPQIYRQCEQL